MNHKNPYQLISIADLSRDSIIHILDTAKGFLPQKGDIQKIPALSGKIVANVFFEPSTRTLTTFEIAAKKLSADVINFNAQISSIVKGESLVDTMQTLQAMGCDLFVIRHSENGAVQHIADHLAPNTPIINAGDGSHAHPTQALLDMLTIQQHKKDFSQVKIAIVGDVLHSRVARSQIHALKALGVPDIRVIGPKGLLPPEIDEMGVQVFHDVEKGIEGVDVVSLLRLQKERMQRALIPDEKAYFEQFGLSTERLKAAKPDAIVMHPGPINRGVEISAEVADGPQSVILQQVRNGVAIRMAVISLALAGKL